VNPYFVLTNRKRTVIALVHTVVFLAVAVRGVAGVVPPLHLTSPATGWIMPAVYLLVGTILLVLAARSCDTLERLYFGCCTTSAGFGFARQVAGDPRLHVAAYVRVVMLLCAVVVGWAILRRHETA
jgi:hypothetical protein